MVLEIEVYKKKPANRTEEEKFNLEQAKAIFEHHKRIGVVLEVSQEVFQEIYTQETRDLIIRVLNMGIVDTHPTTLEPVTRYALSGAEILDKVNELVSKDSKFKNIDRITKSNIFFHLRKLEEVNLVKEAGVIKSGRRRTTYYGKSHKVIIGQSNENKNMFPILNDDNFIEFLMDINPNADLDAIKQIMNNLDILNSYTYDYFIQWLQQNEENLKPYMFNFPNLFSLFNFIQRFDPKTADTLQELSKLLQIDQEELQNQVRD